MATATQKRHSERVVQREVGMAPTGQAPSFRKLLGFLSSFFLLRNPSGVNNILPYNPEKEAQH